MRKIPGLPLSRGRGVHSPGPAGSARADDAELQTQEGDTPANGDRLSPPGSPQEQTWLDEWFGTRPRPPGNGGSEPGTRGAAETGGVSGSAGQAEREGAAVGAGGATRAARRARRAASGGGRGRRSSAHAEALSSLERISESRRSGSEPGLDSPLGPPPGPSPAQETKRLLELDPGMEIDLDTELKIGPPPRRPAPRPERVAPDRGRRGLPAGKIFLVMLICLSLWALLDSHSLKRSAEASPVGARRTAALTVLGPINWVGDATGLAYLGDFVKNVLGRPTGGPEIKSTPPVPIAKGPRLRHVAAPAPRPAPGAQAAPPLGPPPLPQPSPAVPLRVLAVGDSIGEDLGQSLVSKLSATGEVNATLDGKISTGLARPDYFDWPAELRTDVARFQPDVTVVMMGANDNQSLLVNGNGVPFGSPEWITEYSQRVGTMMDEATAQGGRMIWVGEPIMPSSGFSAQMQVLNRIAQTEAASRPAVSYLDSWHDFVDASGNYAAYLPDAAGGQQEVREPDGVHLSPEGSDRLADATTALIENQYHIHLGP